MKDAEGNEIIYWIKGSAGICPECGNHNAMLDIVQKDEAGNRYEDLECRDCGHHCHEGTYVNVEIGMDVENREYTGVASDGVTVSLASFDGNGLVKYLKAYPTQDKW